MFKLNILILVLLPLFTNQKSDDAKRDLVNYENIEVIFDNSNSKVISKKRIDISSIDSRNLSQCRIDEYDDEKYQTANIDGSFIYFNCDEGSANYLSIKQIRILEKSKRLKINNQTIFQAMDKLDELKKTFPNSYEEMIGTEFPKTTNPFLVVNCTNSEGEVYDSTNITFKVDLVENIICEIILENYK